MLNIQQSTNRFTLTVQNKKNTTFAEQLDNWYSWLKRIKIC